MGIEVDGVIYEDEDITRTGVEQFYKNCTRRWIVGALLWMS